MRIKSAASGFGQATWNLLAAGLVAMAMLVAPQAHSVIITNPASIVDHGTYIADTTHNLEWLKFGQGSVGLSFNQALATFGPAGWQAATQSQVRDLIAEFGSTTDTTAGGSSNANAGLTRALGSYLDYTEQTSTTDRILAMYGPCIGSCLVNYSEFDHNSFFDDYVKVVAGLVDADVSFSQIGTWLIREASQVPEPTTLALIGVSLLGLGFRRRKPAA